MGGHDGRTRPTRYPHGVMFHHFHGAGHPVSQGSITADELRGMLDSLADHELLDAGEWIARARTGRLRERDVVLTFDDNLRCQYDVAYPVLRERGLTACWFVYTSVLEDVVETLELYRHFRCSYFGDIDAFYDAFFERVTRSPYADDVACALVTFEPRNYLVDYPFYSDTDRTFRFVRDEILAVDAYEEVMDCMLDDRCVDRAAVASHLWMDGGALRDLHEAGHVIGLHSHTHPTVLAALDARRQREQYERNYEAVRACTGESPTTMSHPTNSYNVDTLKILRSLGVDIGFRADMCGPATSALEHPRQDHANLLAAAKGRP